ncbi:MAG: nucleotide exchange factor GrpE [Candidatus Aminicenantaceae bacterium]
MTKKIETEKDIQEGQERDIEIEFLSHPAKTSRKKPPATAAKKAPVDKALKAKLKRQDEEINELQKTQEELKDEYLRLAAEKDNLRKRLEREKNDYFQFALSDLLKEFLSILDNFDRALESEKNEDCDDSLRMGIELIYKQYLDLLKKQGVQPIISENAAFDPRIQQAFMTEDSDDVDEPTVGEEFQKGYMLHERLLRPALVKVLLPKKSKGQEKE